MASIIRIKRSSGTSLPVNLQWGELAYVTGIGSATGTSQYRDRVYVGDDGTNVISVGGRYYTSMMDHVPGTVAGVTNTRNSDGGIVVVLDNYFFLFFLILFLFSLVFCQNQKNQNLRKLYLAMNHE